MDLKSVKALVIESDTSRSKRVAALLAESSESALNCVAAHSLSIANSVIRKESIDVVVSGLELADARGLDVLVSLNSLRDRIPVIALAEGSEPDIVLDAVRSLSDDCLFWKGLKGEELVQSLAFALERRDLLRELQEQQTGDKANGLETSYRGVVDAVDEAIFVVSRDTGILLYANATAQSWFGGKIGEVLEDALEYDLLEVDEVEMEISIRNAPLPRAALRSLSVNWDGEEACMISMRDISKQKRAEEAFLASQRRLNYSTRGAGFWSWNLSLGEISFAGSFRANLGYDEDAFPNSVSTFRDALHPEDRARVLNAFKRWKKSPRNEFEIKFRIQCFDGLYISVLSRGGRVVQGDSDELLFAGSLIRTNERKEAYESFVVEKDTGFEGTDLPQDRVEPDTGEARACALIVDDEEVLRKALDSIVRSHGLETILAGDGAEGIELYEANRADLKLVILDVNMPRVDGIKVFERIRDGGDAVPIIMTSGNDDKDALPFTDGEGDNCAFLLKPFGLADVKKIVKRMVDEPVAAGG